MPEETTREMPKYKCHKEVWAFKIKSIDPTDTLLGHPPTGAIITPEEEGYEPFYVDDKYLDKNTPHVGGYYVVYADGYKSFSPAHAFESGYALIK